MASQGLVDGTTATILANELTKYHTHITLLPIGGKRKLMNNNNPSPQCTSTKGPGVYRSSPQWLRLPLLLLVVAVAIIALAATALADAPAAGDASAPSVATVPTVPTPPPSVIYLGFKTSDEIEFDSVSAAASADDKPDFKYKNEDIVAFVPDPDDPSTGEFSIFFDGSVCGLANANLDDFEVLSNGHILFTLRARFNIPGFGQVDDSDVIEYTPGATPDVCGTFAFRLVGADAGLTKGAEDIDGLGIAEDGDLIVSTIGTAKVPGSAGEVLEAKDQDLIRFDDRGVAPSGTWSLYFDGSDVELKKNSEDIRSVWLDNVGDAQGNKNLYLTLSGNFKVASLNEDEGDKNDVEGCFPSSLGTTTECFFFKLLDGETIGAENQLDGLSVLFGPRSVAASAVTALDDTDSTEATETADDIADFAEALAENDSEITEDDFMEVAQRFYLPYVRQ